MGALRLWGVGNRFSGESKGVGPENLLGVGEEGADALVRGNNFAAAASCSC